MASHPTSGWDPVHLTGSEMFLFGQITVCNVESVFVPDPEKWSTNK